MRASVGVSPGIAIGKALIYEVAALKPETRMIQAADISTEKAKVDAAIADATEKMERVLAKIDRKSDETAAELMEIHIELCADPVFVKKIYHYVEISLCTAAAAVLRATDDMVKMFEEMEDEYYAARAADISDVGSAVAYSVLGLKKVDLSVLETPVIIFADDLTPSETITMDQKNVLGFVTRKGSRTSHTAILAKNLGIPAIVGADFVGVSDGMQVIVDGSTGDLISAPTAEQTALYTERRTAFLENVKRLQTLQKLAGETVDGHSVSLFINISEPKEAGELSAAGADGVGLFRSEFLFMNSKTLPNEETQFAAYKEAAIRAGGKPVIIRTLDVGGDKKLPYLDIAPELNPFLGYRAIRYCLDNPDVFKTQLRALLRASAFGELRIMFPMVCCMSEIKRAKLLLAECKSELAGEGVAFDESIKTGIMIEIPSVAAAAELYAKEVDFFSIGTNDLCQYTLAVDRMNEKIASLYNHFNPGVLRLIKNTISAGAAAGIEVGMCGEMASDPLAAVLLLGLGLPEFSVSAGSVPYVKDVIRAVSYEKAKEMAAHALTLDSGVDIKNYLEEKLSAK